jgi:hypothetical protein
LPLTYSQTFKRVRSNSFFIEFWVSIAISSGPCLVSRTGDDG